MGLVIGLVRRPVRLIAPFAGTVAKTRTEFFTMNDFLQIIAHLVTLVGLPLAIWLYLQEKRRAGHARAYGAWHSLDDQYHHFLELCLARPELDVFEPPLPDAGEVTPAQIRQERIMFRMLLGLFQRAYVMFHDPTTDVEERQWSEWVARMREYAARENFRLAWLELGPRFEVEFVGFMDDLMVPDVHLECPISCPIN
jgi:hypothetical protein